MSESQKEQNNRRLSALSCSMAGLLIAVSVPEDFHGTIDMPENIEEGIKAFKRVHADGDLKVFIRERLACLSKRKKKSLCDFTIGELRQAVMDAEEQYYAEIPF